MPDSFVEAFVDKLMLLERRTGARVRYQVLAPFPAAVCSHEWMQESAKHVGCFAGLGNFTFIVAAAKQAEKVGGHVDLSLGDKNVFIEIDPSMLRSSDTASAVLCHEVTHKWLQANGIRSGFGIDNEILTDIASVFLGFGKIMLNGCRTEAVQHNTVWSGGVQTLQTTTHTTTTGYLDRDQLAFVYGLCCAMRKIPSSEYMRGLNAGAARAVRACESSFADYYGSQYHDVEAAERDQVGFENAVRKAQLRMAELDKHVNYLRRSVCNTVDGFLKTGHGRIEALRRSNRQLSAVVPVDPALRFLQAIKVHIDTDRLSEQVRSVLLEADGLLVHTKEITGHVPQHSQCFPLPSGEMFDTVVCPLDGKKLRLPKDSGDLIGTCPTCKYRFAYNTRPIVFSGRPGSARFPFWRKIGRLLRKREEVVKATVVD